MRKINKSGGGANTNKNGLWFEQTTSLNHSLLQNGFTILGSEVYFDNCFVGWSVPQNQIYSQFLRPQGIHYQNYNSKGWRPDECFINQQNQTVYIIEKKFQNSSGSVDEKLASCHFKMLEYKKLFEPLGYNVEFIYIFNDWFKQDQYKDVLEYIREMGCYYFYNSLPLTVLGLK